MKNLVLLMGKGISTALSLFAVTGMIFDIMYGGNFYLENWMYTKMIIGSIIVGIGFSAPSVVYESEKLSYGIKVLIHMGTGFVIMLITGFAVGWIPKENGIAACAVVIGGQLAIAVVLWICYKRQFERLAEKMNERIQMMNKDDE